MTQTAPVIASDCKRRLSVPLQSKESIRQEAMDKPRSVRSFIHPVFFYFELHGKVFTKGRTGHWNLVMVMSLKSMCLRKSWTCLLVVSPSMHGGVSPKPVPKKSGPDVVLVRII